MNRKAAIMKRGNVAQITLRIPLAMDEQLSTMARRNHITQTEQIRRLLAQGLSLKTYQEDETQILNMRQALREVLDPAIERLAKLGSKNSIASSVSLRYVSMLMYRLCKPESKPHMEPWRRPGSLQSNMFNMPRAPLRAFLRDATAKLSSIWEDC